jgi:hypothetical protein
MKFARELMESKSMLDRIPDQSILIESDETPGERIQATRGKDYVFVYSCIGKRFRLKMAQIPGEKSAFFWVNPRTGEKSSKNNINNTGIQTFTPPTKGYGLDWVMVLESIPDPKPEVKVEPAATEVKPSLDAKAPATPSTPANAPEVKVDSKPQPSATSPLQTSAPTTTPAVVPEVKPQASATSPLQTSAPTTTPAVVPEVKPQASPTSTLQASPATAPTAPTANTAAGNSSATTVNAVQPVNQAEVKAPN